jgi:hypothetical protein
MTPQRLVGVCLWLVITSAGAAGQPGSDTTAQPPQAPPASVIERTYPIGDVLPWRRVETRTESGGRELVVQTDETPGVDGRMEPVQEISIETIRTGADTGQTRRDVFGFGAGRQRRLLETTLSRQGTAAGGARRTIQDTWVSDVNGRLGLKSRRIEESRLTAPDTHRVDTTLLRQGIDGALRETERTEDTERRINPAVVRHDVTHLVLDMNGRWQPTEARRTEIRDIGSSERLEEETVLRRDTAGVLVVSERNVTRRSEANGRAQVIVETFARNMDGFPRSDSPREVRQRVQMTTTATADGGRNAVEELEARSPVAPSDSLRAIRRIVTTVRRTGPDRWVTERQIFQVDANGRLAPVIADSEETAQK